MDNYEPNILPLCLCLRQKPLLKNEKKISEEKETIDNGHLMKISISLLECLDYILAIYFQEGIRKYKIIPPHVIPLLTSPPFLMKT